MAEVAMKHQRKLKSIKCNIENAENYWKSNRENYKKFMKFIFLTALTVDDISILSELEKPQIESNIIEAFISRLRGEFSKQEPSIITMPMGGQPVDPQLVDVIGLHLREKLDEANKKGFEYCSYTDLLGGGYSAWKIWTDYENDYSFQQDIFVKKIEDVTKVGWDPTAKNPSKDDGGFCYEKFYQTEREFKSENPGVDLKKIKFNKSDTGINWSYKNDNERILLVCDYYIKKTKKKKLVKFVDGETMLKEEAQSFLDEWRLKIESGMEMRVPPVIIDERDTKIVTICRYRLIEDQIIEYVETDYDYFPLICVDGNSVWLVDDGDGMQKQHTRSYAHQAIGIQRFKNMCLQTFGNEIENTIQHKFISPIEGMCEKYQDAYINIQKASTVLYQAYKDQSGINGAQPLPVPPPQVIARPPIPPEIAQGFMMSDQTMQMILGSFDSQLGINENQLSGVAIVEAATQSNAAAMPYIVGFMQGLTHLATVMLSLFPKYYKNERTIPIKDQKDKRQYIQINKNGAPNFDYRPGSIGVKVEAGVNFAVQKSKALSQIIALMGVSQQFSAFMNQKGLPFLLNNIEIYDVDKLKAMAEEWVMEQEQQQQQQQQQQQMMMQQQPNPLMIKQQEIQQKAQAAQMDYQIRKESNQNDAIKTVLAAKNEGAQTMVQLAKAHAENLSTAAELALKHGDQQHRHKKDDIEIAHNIMSKTMDANQNNEGSDNQ